MSEQVNSAIMLVKSMLSIIVIILIGAVFHNIWLSLLSIVIVPPIIFALKPNKMNP